jgi:HAD superfamily hydrolase (TIGR01509 family)
MSIILLDIGNVVVSVDFLAFCNAVALDPVSGAQEIYRKYCIGEFKDKLETGFIAPFEYLDVIARDPHSRTMPLHELKHRWQNIFALQEGAHESVGQLKEKHSVWIMSDTDPLHFTFLLNNFPLLRGADRYYLSFEHGNMKNSADAFAHVLESSGCGADEFILIDDKAENCVSASTAGIESILFQNWEDTLALL